MKLHSSQFGQSYLESHALDLLKFALGSQQSTGGYGYLSNDGNIDHLKPMEVYVQARMIQVFGIGHLLQMGNYVEQVKHGIKSINNFFEDKKSGGYYNSIDKDLKPVTLEKIGYDHVFVLLAASMAMAMGVSESERTFHHINHIIDKYFWDDKFQMMHNHWSLDFSILDDYRGMNVNMHAVEAFLATYDLSKDAKYLTRAYKISKRTVLFAEKYNWFIPEHYDSSWNPDLNFNINKPNDPFRPFGVTIGHLFEWSRLLIQLNTELEGPRHDWIINGAVNLYNTAKKFGWAPDGEPGFVYTIGWDGRVVSDQRMFWVPAEAVMAAYALWNITGNEDFFADYETWWNYIDTFVRDKTFGSWHHELDKNQSVTAKTWSGKPDIYHAMGAATFPLLPISRSFLGSLVQI